MKYLLTIFLLAQSFNMVEAQHTDLVLKDSINNQLAMLKTFPQTLYDDELSFDPDSLSAVTADNIVKYVKTIGFDNLNIDDFSGIELNSDSSNYPLSVISFGYDSGGTARIIPTSIIIKKDKDGYIYYNMSGYEADFFEIHHLKDDIYLCFAIVPGWGACINQSASVFKFTDKMTPVPIFNNFSDFSVCNSDLSFDKESMLLTIGSFTEDLMMSSNEGVLKVFKEENAKNSDGDYNGVLTSKFNGEEFIKP